MFGIALMVPGGAAALTHVHRHHHDDRITTPDPVPTFVSFTDQVDLRRTRTRPITVTPLPGPPPIANTMPDEIDGPSPVFPKFADQVAPPVAWGTPDIVSPLPGPPPIANKFADRPAPVAARGVDEPAVSPHGYGTVLVWWKIIAAACLLTIFGKHFSYLVPTHPRAKPAKISRHASTAVFEGILNT
jgi:hypothetical protein